MPIDETVVANSQQTLERTLPFLSRCTETSIVAEQIQDLGIPPSVTMMADSRMLVTLDYTSTNSPKISIAISALK